MYMNGYLCIAMGVWGNEGAFERAYILFSN